MTSNIYDYYQLLQEFVYLSFIFTSIAVTELPTILDVTIDQYRIIGGWVYEANDSFPGTMKLPMFYWTCVVQRNILHLFG